MHDSQQIEEAKKNGCCTLVAIVLLCGFLIGVYYVGMAIRTIPEPFISMDYQIHIIEIQRVSESRDVIVYRKRDFDDRIKMEYTGDTVIVAGDIWRVRTIVYSSGNHKMQFLEKLKNEQ